MPIKLFIRAIKLFFISTSFILIAACNPFIQTSSLEKIQKRGDIIMGTINSSLTYSYDGNTYNGFDYELGKQFATYLDVKLTIKEYGSLNELFSALDNNSIDFVGSGLTLTPKRAEKYRSSPPYYYVSQKVVYHKGTYRPRKIADVNAPISVLVESSHAETLDALIEENPNIEIKLLDNEDQETLLRKVANKEIKITSACVLQNIQRLSKHNATQNQPSLSLINFLRNVLFQWRTPETVAFFGCHNTESEKDKSDFEKKYTLLGKKIDKYVRNMGDLLGEDGLADDGDTPKQQLPDYEQLKKDTAEFEVKVKEFYIGDMKKNKDEKIQSVSF